MTSVLILAAGTSQRLGRPKQMELLDGETLIARAIRVALESALGPVHVVVRRRDQDIVSEAKRLGCNIIFNDEADEGVASSVRAGVRAVAGETGAILIMACDQPAVTAEHLRRLANNDAAMAAASLYEGRRGVPAWFPARFYPELLKLHGDKGARELLKSAAAIELVGGELDIDTETDLANARMLSATLNGD